MIKNQSSSYFIKRSYITHGKHRNMWWDFIFLETFLGLKLKVKVNNILTAVQSFSSSMLTENINKLVQIYIEGERMK